MKRRLLGALLGILLLAVVPGCRALGAAATFVGAVALEVALDSVDDDDHDDCEPQRRRSRGPAAPNPSRSAARPPADPSR
jgi:hypothetical protein